MIKKMMALGLAVCLCYPLSGCGAGGEGAKDAAVRDEARAGVGSQTGSGEQGGSEAGQKAEGVKVFQMGYPDPDTPNSHYAYFIKKLNENLEEICGGKIRFDGVPNGQLGTETDMLNGMSDGSIDCACISVDTYSSQIPVMQVFSLPYIFSYPEQFEVLTDNEAFMKPIQDILENDWNIVCLGSAINGGARTLITKKDVNSIEDVKNLTLRITTSNLLQKNWESVGAIPTIVAFNETYTAFSQGVVDAVEVPIETHYFMSFYEAGQSVAKTNMVTCIGWPMMSKKTWDSLSGEEQEWITQACDQAVVCSREHLKVSEEEVLKKMADEKGIYVTEPDLEPFKQATAVVYEEYTEIIGEETLRSAYRLLDEDNEEKGYSLLSDRLK